ncbi:hypothetical protein J4217_03760 [Candidatus Pacearchaeota archaeon]|nr:hypothetical protein [uncultured archaeon]AQS33244.1 hypothetical protein [uncultured archaeon]MBS3091535.1 hypothetical protein [Candidatus Pacearchaeota archaeon]
MDFKQKFEPKGNRVLHGAGQSPEAFSNYCKAVGKYKPVIYMTYVKAFCYINWDWVKDWKDPNTFAHWLNGRIHENEIVRKHYFQELKNGKYIHNQPINKVLKLLYP